MCYVYVGLLGDHDAPLEKMLGWLEFGRSLTGTFTPNYVSNLCTYYQTQDCSPAVKGHIYPQLQNVFFLVLILFLLGMYNDIQGGVELSPLSNFRNSLLRPTWPPPGGSKI